MYPIDTSFFCGKGKTMNVSKIKFWSVFFVLCFYSSFGVGKVVELGEESFFGKKDQPGAMTFISRTSLEEDTLIPDWKFIPKIKDVIQDNFFSAIKAE